MYTTLKRIISKHTSAEDIIAWKGFLLGIALVMLTIGPLITLTLLFVFKDYNDLDDIIIEHLDHF